MMRGLAVELARYKIRANSILPGWIETDMTQRLTTNDTFHGKVMPRIPMRRWGRGEDFGGIASVGQKLFSDYLFPFEMLSFLLLAAVVGALVLSKRKL